MWSNCVLEGRTQVPPACLTMIRTAVHYGVSAPIDKIDKLIAAVFAFLAHHPEQDLEEAVAAISRLPLFRRILERRQRQHDAASLHNTPA